MSKQFYKIKKNTESSLSPFRRVNLTESTSTPELNSQIFTIDGTQLTSRKNFREKYIESRHRKPLSELFSVIIPEEEIKELSNPKQKNKGKKRYDKERNNLQTIAIPQFLYKDWTAVKSRRIFDELKNNESYESPFKNRHKMHSFDNLLMTPHEIIRGRKHYTELKKIKECNYSPFKTYDVDTKKNYLLDYQGNVIKGKNHMLQCKGNNRQSPSYLRTQFNEDSNIGKDIRVNFSIKCVKPMEPEKRRTETHRKNNPDRNKRSTKYFTTFSKFPMGKNNGYPSELRVYKFLKDKKKEKIDEIASYNTSCLTYNDLKDFHSRTNVTFYKGLEGSYKNNESIYSYLKTSVGI